MWILTKRDGEDYFFHTSQIASFRNCMEGTMLMFNNGREIYVDIRASQLIHIMEQNGLLVDGRDVAVLRWAMMQGSVNDA